ncbi:MAG: peptidoglycan D,D-transpeptidase FtsI family protein, partial [Alloprevotella sp.]
RQAKTLPLFKLSANRGGFHAEEIKTRKNPFGRLAIRTIGDLYKGKDSARTGIELSFDSILRGKPGNAHRQKVLNRYLTIVDKPAEDGCDVVTTLDVGMQDICEKALNDKLVEIGANSGVCILMEVATGDIKAMTSLTRVADGVYQEINADAVKNLYEPGSVFKPMSFLVGMDDGFIKMTDVVDVGCGIKEMYGRKMRDANWRSGGSGVVTVPQILQKSLNVGVSTLIDRYYHDNPQKFVAGIYRIGVNEDLKIPIPGYAKPRIRMPKEDGSNWSKTALPWMSIGYETQIPPITTVNFYNGIANNGKLLRPRLVKAIMKNGEVIKEYPVVVLRERMASAEAVKNIQECLESVVSVGLGKKAGSKYFHTSGKTGTAQIWTKSGFSAEYLVSFAGYFPSEKPLYSCIVCIQKSAPASGGGMCAPVFKRVAETVMAQRHTSDYSQARDTVNCLRPTVCAGQIDATVTVLNALDIPHNEVAPETDGNLVWAQCETNSASVTLNPTGE